MTLNRRSFNLSALAAACGSSLASLCGISSSALAQALDEADGRPAGPMVGRVTDNTASIWLYTPHDATVSVELDRDGDLIQEAVFEKIPMEGLDLRGQAWGANLANLAPQTRYEYRVLVDGRAAEEQRGSLQTAPESGAPTQFRLGLTSCMKIEKPQTSWPLFLNQNPTLHLTLGDTVYADTTDSRMQWRHHLRYRQSPEFAAVIRAMPTYSIWDDHDFGPNNSDGTAAGKEQSLAGWKRVWINPDAGTENIPGAFYRFGWGDVDFFVVDGRYHRSPGRARDDAQKTMLGDEQFNWLLSGLRSSQAKFKVVASGSTLEHSQADGWRVYTHSRHQFFNALKEHRIDGVFYCSGSPHNSWAWEHHESDLVGYPLVEVVSSGIANGKHLSFATIDFDTTIDDPTMSVRIVHGSGRVRDEQTWRLSQLSHG